MKERVRALREQGVQLSGPVAGEKRKRDSESEEELEEESGSESEGSDDSDEGDIEPGEDYAARAWEAKRLRLEG